jgi:hypothetical protein
LKRCKKKAVGIKSGLKSRVYEERLKEVNLSTLEERRHQMDMLQMFSLMHGGENLDSQLCFKPYTAAANTRLRADALNVRPNHGRHEIRRNLFSVRAGDTVDGTLYQLISRPRERPPP